MRTLNLSARERWYLLAAFTQPVKGPQGPKGADIAELRKAGRIFDKLALDAFNEGGRPEPGESKQYQLEDADFAYLDRVFRDASSWTRSPELARDLIRIDDVLTQANKKE